MKTKAGLVLLLVLGGCAHTPPPLVVAGDVLDGAGIAFESIAAGMQVASDAHVLTAEQVLSWNDFKHRWTAGYKGSAALWRAAKATKDDVLAVQVEAVLRTFLGELAQWQLVVATGGGK